MAFNDFWTSLQVGASLVNSKVEEIGASRSSSSKTLKSAWLTPAIVKGYRTADFTFLDSAERDQLDRAVDEFRRLAATVPDSGPATASQIKTGAESLRKVLEVVDFTVFRDPDAFLIGKRIEAALRRDASDLVDSLQQVETGLDVGGAQAIWIWVLVYDEAAEEGAIRRTFERIRTITKEVLDELGDDRWPYVRLVGLSEKDYARAATV